VNPVVRVLSADDRAVVHERTLDVLAQTGVRVDTARGRAILAEAGAAVDESTARVCFPRELVETSLRAAPRDVTFGGRRPGWSLSLDGRDCRLVADGEATWAWDAEAGVRRATTYDDWVTATCLIDAIEDVGVYWRMAEAGLRGPDPADAVRHWHEAFNLFSRHVQDAATTPVEARWLLEVLAVVAGDRDAVAVRRPFSFIVCPASPLAIEGTYTDAWLETAGWSIPVAIMPMPLMGLSAPAGLAATIVAGNAEVLAMLCLVQAADPGTPVIYAPAFSVMEPRTGRFGGGGPEHALLGAAATEMARFYGLPAEASAGGTDHHVPGIQAAYERAVNWTLPALAWPDLLVGPGCLGGATTLSLEQLLIDVEVFHRCRRIHDGIGGLEAPRSGLDGLLAELAAGSDFTASPLTRDALRAGEWHVAGLGVRSAFERWDEAGRPDLLDEARERMAALLASRRPLPLDEAQVRELERIERAAQDEASTAGVPGAPGATRQREGAR
jgi:trimethylamine--corrinoid protein Co-methyltransferase